GPRNGIRRGVVGEEREELAEPRLPEEQRGAVHDGGRDREAGCGTPRPAPKIVHPERRKEVDDPELDVEAEPEAEREQHPLEHRPVRVSEQSEAAERDRQGEEQVVRAHRSHQDLERGGGDESPGEDRRYGAIAAGDEQRVGDHRNGCRDHPRRQEERGLRHAEQLERRDVQHPPAEADVKLIVPVGTVAGNAHKRRELDGNVSQDESAEEMQAEGEREEEQRAARGDVYPAAAHVSCSGRADVWGLWRTRRGETAKDEALSTRLPRLVEGGRTRSLPEPLHGALEALG